MSPSEANAQIDKLEERISTLDELYNQEVDKNTELIRLNEELKDRNLRLEKMWKETSHNLAHIATLTTQIRHEVSDAMGLL